MLIARSPNRYVGSPEFCGQSLRMWLQQKGSEHRPLPGLDPRRRGYEPSKCGVVTGLPRKPFHFLGLFVGRLDMPDVYRVV